MDFFEAQARAKRRTTRLVVLFALAVIGTILAMYMAALLIFGQGRQFTREYDAYGNSTAYSTSDASDWWRPDLFGGVALTTLAIVGLGSLYKWSSFSAGGRAVAESVGGRRVDPGTRDLAERRLLNVVEEMAIASGVPVPAVYILGEEPAINAFAAGLTTNDAVVAVTRGTLEKLNRDELQGVVAHEFSHILNGDMRLNLRIAAIIFGILVLGIIGRGILWSMRGVRVSRGKKGGGPGAILAIGLALLIIGYIGYFFGRMIQAAVSRQREFLADASAVQFTRNPGGIAGALKKIGGYALGSTVQSNQSAAIGHFFFAQAFRTGITGLWATHPPLEERIRAIDASFDGKFFEPPQVVDVARESFASAGLAGPQVRQAQAAPGEPPVLTRPAGTPPRVSTAAPVEAVGAIAVLTPAQIDNAHTLLDSTPPRLRAAAHSAQEARVLLFGLLLNAAQDVRDRQHAMVAGSSDSDAQLLKALEPDVRNLKDEQRLPLLQIALPSLRQMSPAQMSSFLGVLDELVHADAHVSPFEYAMQRVLTRALALGEEPGAAVVQYHSFHALGDEIALVLSVLARSSTQDANAARGAFAAGAAQLKLIESRLAYRTGAEASLEGFDAALDKLARASLPIKKRTLIASAHVVKADGRVLVSEFELLRAVAAALDVPMPLMSAVE